MQAFRIRASLSAGAALTLVLGALALGTGALAAAAPQPALEALPRRSDGGNNVLNPNEDATFRAIKAERAAKLSSLTPVTDQVLKAPKDGDWLTWRRTWASTGYSPLAQITKANAARLTTAWSYVLPVSGNEITPLVHDGVLFVESGNSILAIDGASGDLLWQYMRQLPAALNGGRSAIVKNIAIYGDRIYAPTADGHVVALEAKTGKLVWDHEVLGEKERASRLTLDGGPIVAKGKVVMGASGCNTYKGGCFIFALDTETGNEAWRFHTVDQSPVGQDSWNGAPIEERFGGSIWTSGSYDADLGLLYFGVGNTYSTATLLRPHAEKGASNDGLYTAATVALDIDTGKLKWAFQHVNREVWDLDWVFEQSLITMPVNGKPANLVVTGGKIALFDAIDRATGKYAFSRDAGVQTLITGIDPVTGKKTINPAAEPEAGVMKKLCPHSGGGRNWPATAIDVRTQVLYVQIHESCQDFTWNPKAPGETAQGGNDMQWVLHPRPDGDGKIGRVQAIDLKTGKTLWSQRRRSAYASSILATAGGVMFVGSRDRFFHAYDSSTGKLLWNARLAASASSTPITYTAGGEQYVALVAGNGGPVAWNTLTPEIENPTGGTVLTVFKVAGAAKR